MTAEDLALAGICIDGTFGHCGCQLCRSEAAPAAPGGRRGRPGNRPAKTPAPPQPPQVPGSAVLLAAMVLGAVGGVLLAHCLAHL